MRDEFLTVSELNNFIRDVLTSGFPQALWVCGEIQGLKEKSGHLYFTIVEKAASGGITAKIDVKIWANNRFRINAVLNKAENPFQLKDDIEVKLLCKVDFYPPFGQVSLIAENIDPIYTLGKLAQDRLRLIALLKQRGILDQNKKLAMSRVPLNVGLITSYDSAAYHDFIDEIKRSGYGFRIFAVDAVMQGKNTETSVVQALRSLNAIKEIDLLVITRGGGSIVELSCFDSQLIAEAVAASRLPVLSGIGHEINTTVTDLAAHTFAKTPTAVAQFLVGKVGEFLDHLNEKGGTLTRLAQESVSEERRRIQSWAEGLKKTIHLRLQNSRVKIGSYQKLVAVADPKNTLKRGFSITRDAKGRAVRSAASLKLKQEIVTELADGVFTAEVTLLGHPEQVRTK